MTDYNTEKTKSILKKHSRQIFLKMFLVFFCWIFISLSEYFCQGFANKDHTKILIFLVFFLIRLFFLVPLSFGIFRSISGSESSQKDILLCYFSDLKSFFGAVFAVIFTCVYVFFEFSVLTFFYYLLNSVFGYKQWFYVLTLLVSVVILFCIFLRSVFSLINCFKASTRDVLAVYLNSFGAFSAVHIAKKLRPCISRLFLAVLLVPAFYVLPFTFVRMTLREN